MSQESPTTREAKQPLAASEADALDRVLGLCRLPDRFRSSGAGGGVIHDDAAQSTLVAVVSARERIAGQWRMAELVAYASESERESVLQALKVAGFFEEQLRLVPVDGTGAMDTDQLRLAMVDDLVAEKRPCYVHATFGDPATRQADSIADVASVCKDFGAWLHVEGGTAGATAIDPEMEEVNAGLRRADSYCLDVLGRYSGTADCSLFYIADRGPMISAFATSSSAIGDRYFETDDSDQTWRIATNTATNLDRLWEVVLSEHP